MRGLVAIDEIHKYVLEVLVVVVVQTSHGEETQTHVLGRLLLATSDDFIGELLRHAVSD